MKRILATFLLLTVLAFSVSVTVFASYQTSSSSEDESSIITQSKHELENDVSAPPTDEISSGLIISIGAFALLVIVSVTAIAVNKKKKSK